MCPFCRAETANASSARVIYKCGTVHIQRGISEIVFVRSDACKLAEAAIDSGATKRDSKKSVLSLNFGNKKRIKLWKNQQPHFVSRSSGTVMANDCTETQQAQNATFEA